jgi:hypothetical protein
MSELREGQRVRVVIEGTVTESGDIQISVGPVGMRGVCVYVSPELCVSIEPVPVVVEPGKWYCPADNDQSEDYYYYGLPGGAVQCYYVGRGLNRWGNNPPSEYQGWLVECDPPAEFRDGA